LQVDADLWRGQTRPIGRDHGVVQIHRQRLELWRAELSDRLGDAQQARIAHAEDRLNGHGLS
jgi:hypothetical protein